jgi:hypothetical protein
VIQRTNDAGEAFFNVEEIHDETLARVHRPVQLDLDPVGMTTQSAARCVSGTFGSRCAASNLNACDIFIRFLTGRGPSAISAQSGDQMLSCSDRHRRMARHSE